MRRFVRFRLRTLLALVTILALVLGIGRKKYEQHLMELAIEDVLENSTVDRVRIPNRFEPWDIVDSPVFDNHPILEQNLSRSVDELLQVAATETSYVSDSLTRKSRALLAIRVLAERSGSAKVRRMCFDRTINLLLTQPLPSRVEGTLIRLLGHWVSSTGISTDQRARLLELGKAQPGKLSAGWSMLLLTAGGREEIEFVVNRCSGGPHPHELFNLDRVIHSQALIRTRWRGMLPHLDKWLQNQSLVQETGLLQWPILWETREGRQLLIKYVVTTGHPRPLRVHILDRLLKSEAGIIEIEEALENPVFAPSVTELLGDASPQRLAKIGAEVKQENDRIFWTALIDNLEPAIQVPSVPAEKKELSEAEKFNQEVLLTSSLPWLQKLSGRTDLRSKEEWLAWYEQEKPAAVPQAKILRHLLETESCPPVIYARVAAPRHLKEISPECVALYKEILKIKKLRSAATYALLLYTNNTDAVPTVIDMIEASGHYSQEIHLLRNRFAVNFFWDDDAWREWWKCYQQSNEFKAQKSGT